MAACRHFVYSVLQTWVRHVAPTNVKSLKSISHLGADFYPKFGNFAILSYLIPNFYAYDVEICLKRTDLGNIRNPSMTKFRQNRSMDRMA